MRGWLLGLGLLCLLFAPGTGHAAGSRYRVTLITLSPAEEVFERFGHTVLSIEDTARAEAWVYSFGTFDGDATYLWHKALYKRLRYWAIVMTPLRMSLRYDHREGAVQELALEDAQAAQLAERLAWMVRPENREYPYDLFTDNCVTRIRDLLDEACGGALHRQTAGPAPYSFRQQVVQSLAEVPLLAAMATLVYGRYTDAPRSRWETLFLPSTLHTVVAEIELGEGSARHPLVKGETHWQGTLWTPPRGLPHPLWGPVLLGLILLYGMFCWVRGRVQTGRAVLGATAALLSLLMGLIGLALCYLQTTPHRCFQNNENSFLLSPLSLVGVPLFLLLARDRLGRSGQRVLVLTVSLAALLPVIRLLVIQVADRAPQANGRVWLVAAPLHAVLIALALLLTSRRS